MAMENLEECCPYCECETGDVLEHDADTDMFLIRCDNGHNYWQDNEDGAWM